jgi:hypothetical protein
MSIERIFGQGIDGNFFLEGEEAILFESPTRAVSNSILNREIIHFSKTK